MMFEDEPVNVSVERMTNDLAVAEGLIILKCFEVALAPAGFLVLVPEEVGFVDHIIIIVGIVFIICICLLLLLLLLISSLLLFPILCPSLFQSFSHLPLALILHTTVHKLFIVR